MTGNGLASAMGGRAQLLREQDTFDKVQRFIEYEMGKYYDGFLAPRKDFVKAIGDLFTLPKAVDNLPRQVIVLTTGQISLPDLDPLLDVIRARGNIEEPTAPCSGLFAVGIGASHCNYNTLQSTWGGFLVFFFWFFGFLVFWVFSDNILSDLILSELCGFPQSGFFFFFFVDAICSFFLGFFVNFIFFVFLGFFFCAIFMFFFLFFLSFLFFFS